MKATALLKKDHGEVKKLFSRIRQTSDRAVKSRERLVEKIGMELDVHATIEEEIFYPAVSRIGELAEQLREAHKEHEDVKRLLGEIRGLAAGDGTLMDMIEELRDAVLHHAAEEEKEMFPVVEEHLGREELARLAGELEARKRQLVGGRGARSGSRRAA